MRTRIGILLLIAFFIWCGSASAQFGGWKSLAKKAAEKATKKEDSPAPDSKPAEPENSGSTNSSSSTNTPPASNSASAPAENATAATAPGGEPNLVATKIDFIPGEKNIFYDDFSDMPPGEPPPHWKWRGDGPVSLLIGKGVRELSISQGGYLISGNMPLPQNFTVELTAVVYKGSGNPALEFLTDPGDTNSHSELSFDFRDANELDVDVNVGKEGGLGSGKATITPGKPFVVQFWVQNGRIRAYVDGNRIVDANQVTFPPTTGIRLKNSFYGGAGPFGFRSIRVAESAPDPGAVLASTGKFVTHGILFDTDSDILKPESAPVIKEISTTLYKNPSMKLEVDGYTDSTGDAAHNLDLSKRRAAAVAKVLMDQFGIDQGRLSSNGFGADNAIASNDTPDGRAQNRRVEFVKK